MKPQDYGLKSDSFTTEIPDIQRRVIMNAEAREKCGKSTFGLTAPDPLIVFNGDKSLEGVIQKFRDKGKRIIVAGMPRTDGKLPDYTFRMPERKPGERLKGMEYTVKVAEVARPIWRKFKADYLEFLESKRIRSGVMDTGTWFWLLARYANWGAVSPANKNLAGSIKEEFSQLVQLAQDYDKNVIWLHRLRAEYAERINKAGEKESIKTGRDEISGHSEIRFDVQCNVRLGRRVDKSDKKTVFFAEVQDCRINMNVAGEVYDEDLCNFPAIASMIFETSPEEWE